MKRSRERVIRVELDNVGDRIPCNHTPLQTDLAPYSQAELNEVARQLNQRPSKNARLPITGGEIYRVYCIDRLNSPQNAAI